jgi:hypothetical protein
MFSFFLSEVTSSCDPNPCGTHGTCLQISEPLIAHCNCEDRWTGKYCDVNMDGRYCLIFVMDICIKSHI